MEREKFKWKPHKDESTDAERRDGSPRSSDELSVMERKRRGGIIQLELKINQTMGGIFEESEVV